MQRLLGDDPPVGDGGRGRDTPTVTRGPEESRGEGGGAGAGLERGRGVGEGQGAGLEGGGEAGHGPHIRGAGGRPTLAPPGGQRGRTPGPAPSRAPAPS